MKRITLLTVTLLACQRAQQPTSRIAEARHALVGRLDQCSADDRRTLVMIASNHYAWRDGLDERREPEVASATKATRCEAARVLASSWLVWPPNWSGDLRWAEAMHRPELETALREMIQSNEQDCPLRRAALGAVAFPVEWLPNLYDPQEEAADLARYRAFHASPRSEQIDAMMDGTLAGATRFVDMVADYPWPEDEAALTREQLADLDKTIDSAFHWIDQIVLQPSSRGCEIAIRESIAKGELGAKLELLLEHKSPMIRQWTLHIFTEEARPSLRARLQRLAEHEPDAAEALRYIDVGGRSHVSQPGH